ALPAGELVEAGPADREPLGAEQAGQRRDAESASPHECLQCLRKRCVGHGGEGWQHGRARSLCPSDAARPDLMASRRRKSGTPSLRIPLHTEVVRVAERRYRLRRPRSAEELIDERDYERDERLPYWAELWPSARPLAEALAAMPLEGVSVLELGCGLGLPSIVAAGRGARVVATDWYADALQAVARNARSAGVEVP